MDENAVRSLLEQAADGPAPPSVVDIAKARRVGRRHLHLRRFGAPAASMSAIAVVVGLIASGALPIGSGRPASGAHRKVTQWHDASPPFNPLVPQVTFGWLPPGYSLTPGSSLLARTVEDFELSDRSGRAISLVVSPPEHCQLTGPGTGEDARRGTLNCGGPFAPVQFGPAPVTGPMPGLLGGHAYRLGHAKYGGLVFHAAKAWVVIEPSSKLGLATEIRIAAHVRFGSGQPLAFPFQLAGMPSRWRVGSSNLLTLGDRLVGFGLSIGPAPYYGQVSVTAVPAKSYHPCGRSQGSQWVTVGGIRGILQTSRTDHYQNLCFGDVDGLAVSVSVTRPRPFTGKPQVVATAPGGVIDIFLHHLHLLGPDPARWTTHPISG
jgi:hypothetical protein